MSLLKIFAAIMISAPPVVANQPAAPARPFYEQPEELKEHRKVITLALDDSFESKLLQKELTRDWTDSIYCTTESALRVGKKFNAVRDDIKLHYDIIMIDAENAPPDLKYGEFPYISVGRGKFESIDKRAFRDTGLALLTIKYYCDCWRETFLIDEEKERYDEIEKICDKQYRDIRNNVTEAIRKKYNPPADAVVTNISVYCENVSEIYGYNPKTQKWELVLDGVSISYNEALGIQRDLGFPRYHLQRPKYNKASVSMVAQKNYSSEQIDLSDGSLPVPIDIPPTRFPFIHRELRPPWRTGSTYALEYILNPPSDLKTSGKMFVD